MSRLKSCYRGSSSSKTCNLWSEFSLVNKPGQEPSIDGSSSRLLFSNQKCKSFPDCLVSCSPRCDRNSTQTTAKESAVFTFVAAAAVKDELTCWKTAFSLRDEMLHRLEWERLGQRLVFRELITAHLKRFGEVLCVKSAKIDLAANCTRLKRKDVRSEKQECEEGVGSAGQTFFPDTPPPHTHQILHSKLSILNHKASCLHCTQGPSVPNLLSTSPLDQSCSHGGNSKDREVLLAILNSTFLAAGLIPPFVSKVARPKCPHRFGRLGNINLSILWVILDSKLFSLTPQV